MLAESVMRIASLWILLLCCGFGSGYRKQHLEDEDEERWPESVSRARCASRCLSLHSVAALSTPLQNNGSLGWCHDHKLCAKCLEPCKASWDMKRKSSCREMCERAFPRRPWECVTSCEFLQAVLAVKQGVCPPPYRASGFAAACVESCDRDAECPAQKKCCSNDCGHTCQTPKDLYKGVPLKPRKELSFQELPSGRLDVRWSSRFNVSAEPVVHVLQRRWNFGIQPSEDSATPWQLVAQTTEQRVRLSDIRPGRWYQFRVAAVNTHGTRGFTTPSRHIHASRDPSSPPAPSELRVANMSFGPGRTVSARIQWSVPADLDVPVHHYKLTWSWTAAGHPAASSLTKRRKTVRESHVDLDSMRANRSYSVEVQAVSYWGQTQLRGPRAVLHFSTQRAIGAAPSKPAGAMVDVGTPFYQDGQLRVHVYWQKSSDPSVESYRVQWGPEHCAHNQSRAVDKVMEKVVTKESFLHLQDLLFSCQYRVILLPLSQKTRPAAESASFFTPSCLSIRAKSPKPIVCPGEPAVFSEKVLAKAANLSAAFEVLGNNVSAVFSWSQAPPLQQLSGYQVTWTEVVPTSRHNANSKRPHSLISQSQILPADAGVLRVSGLQPDSVYKLEVQTITADGEGPTTSRTFQTPAYQIVHKHKSRLRKYQHKVPIIERH